MPEIKLKNYIDLKIKQPIILYRDQNKADIAAKAAENDKARDAIDALNKNTTEDKNEEEDLKETYGCREGSITLRPNYERRIIYGNTTQ